MKSQAGGIVIVHHRMDRSPPLTITYQRENKRKPGDCARNKVSVLLSREFESIMKP